MHSSADALQGRVLSHDESPTANIKTLTANIQLYNICALLQIYLSLQEWDGRLDVLMRNLRTLTTVYWVNVSESSGAGSPGMSWLKGY